MSVPVLFGISMMMAQSFADAYFIGRVGDAELAALSFAFPILMIVTSVAIGLGAGTSSVVARAYGADDEARARRLATDSLILSFLVTGAISAVGLVTIEPLFGVLGAPAEMMPLIEGYMRILYFSIPLLVVGMVGVSAMRATGDTRLPSKLMMIGAVTNIVLDPMFIFGLGPIPGLGLNGAAWAAFITRCMIFAGTIYFMHVRLGMLSLERPSYAELKRSWVDVLHVGMPAAGTNAIIPAATAVVTAMLARHGPDAVAGFGAASRVEAMTLVPFYALSSIIGPFVGQNMSAGRSDRIFRALHLCTVFCLGTGLLIAIALFALSGILPKLFSDTPEVIRVARQFLWIAPISYGTYGMVMVMNATFNGMGKPMPAVYVSVGRMCVIYIPIAVVLDRYFGVAGIFAAYAIANATMGVLSYGWARASVQAQCDKHGPQVAAPAHEKA
ncbi:MAG: MATE family efflux transporter [Gammaproteobacteria bacterium]|nr:MATE family efflux transporter [Gammaproteobacteria bacterium]